MVPLSQSAVHFEIEHKPLSSSIEVAENYIFI